MSAESIAPAYLPPVPPPLAARGIGLRAQEPEDRPFVRQLFVRNRWEELAPSGWTEAQKTAFLEQQFAFQDLHYSRHYPDCVQGIVLRDGAPIGRLYLDAKPGALLIVDVLLSPEHRAEGIGTGLIGAVFALARARGDAVTIHVEVNNPARRLYDRLGFVETGGGDVYRMMEWRPA